MADNKNWIQEAHLQKGAFGNWVKQHGYSTKNGIPQEAILAGLRSDDPHVRRMASLARTFQNIAKK
jgi:hypothetical protein